METYPAAALRAWSIEIGGSYKTDSDAATGFRQALIDQLTEELIGLVAISDEFRQACGKKGGDHRIDALICALVARAADLNRLEPIPPEAESRAAQEGWIRLPAAQRLRESLS